MTFTAQLQALTDLLAVALPAGAHASAALGQPHPAAAHDAPVIDLADTLDRGTALAWLTWAGFIAVSRTEPFLGQIGAFGPAMDLVSIELMHMQLPGSAWLPIPAETAWSD